MLSDAEKDELAKKHENLVGIIARHVQHTIPVHTNLDDLISFGNLGLANAVRLFDQDKHTEFSTYCKYKIKGAILDGLRSLDPLSRAHRVAINKIKLSLLMMSKEKNSVNDNNTNNEYTLNQVSSFMGKPIAYNDFVLAKNSVSIRILNSLDTGFRKDDSDKPISVEDKNTIDPYGDILKEEYKHLVHNAINSMDHERQKTILKLYFYENLSLSQIALLMNISASRVFGLKKSGLKKVKNYLESKGVTHCLC